MKNNELLKNNVLSDEQLDGVAGGTYLESADDAKKFKEIGISVYDKEILGIPTMFSAEFAKLRSAFEKFGVTVKDHGGLLNENKYYIDGKEVSRDDAWKHIHSQVK